MSIAGELLHKGPFSGIDLSKSAFGQTITEANIDFLLALEGKKPQYAKIDEESPLPADGGTTYYVGKHYSLTIFKSLSAFGDVKGYIYGPVIYFDKEFAPGNMNTVSNLRFYTSEQLNELEKLR